MESSLSEGRSKGMEEEVVFGRLMTPVERARNRSFGYLGTHSNLIRPPSAMTYDKVTAHTRSLRQELEYDGIVNAMEKEKVNTSRETKHP